MIASILLLAGLLAGCGVLTQAAILVGGSALERPAQWLRFGPPAGRDLVAVRAAREHGGGAGRCSGRGRGGGVLAVSAFGILVLAIRRPERTGVKEGERENGRGEHRESSGHLS